MASVTLPSPSHTDEHISPPMRLRRKPRSWPQYLPPALVFALAVGLAGLLFSRYLAVHRQLWCDPMHDRHAHLYSGLSLATDLREGFFGRFVSDLDKFRTWPPLHDGLLVSSALVLGGGDERWAVLPSLFGWVGAAVFAFLLARRAIAPGGTVAGLIAALFVLVSPAQRAYATDVMLESLGACLTLAGLYWYLVSIQDGSPRAWRWLAITLSALFFLKYNYWFLIVLALAGAQFLASPRRWLLVAHHWATAIPWRRWFVEQLRHPLSYVLATLLIVIAAIQFTSGTSVTLAGRTIPLNGTTNLATAAYVFLLLRVLPWLRRDGRRLIAQAEPAVRALVYWHVVPLALWFLWPQRLGGFLWVLYPGSNVGELPDHSTWGGYLTYWNALASDYHIAAWSAALALGLLALAALFVMAGRLRPGAGAVVLLVLIAAALTAHHPNRKSRFLHSWVPVIWVGAGVGAAGLFAARRGAAGWSIRPALGAVVVGGLVLSHLPGLTQPAHAPEGGVRPSAASFLDVTDAYLPHLADARRVAVFSNLPMKFAAQWTYLQRYPGAERPETEIKGFNPDGDNRTCVAHWLATTRCDTVVYVDVPPGSTFDVPLSGGGLTRYGELLREQTVFRPVHHQELIPYGCSVTVWRRAEP